MKQYFDFFVEHRHKKMIVFGAGTLGRTVAKHLPIAAEYCVDNNSNIWNTLLSDVGLPVKSPALLRQEIPDSIVILVASMYYIEIKGQLEAMGFCENRHFFDARPLFESFLTQPAELPWTKRKYRELALEMQHCFCELLSFHLPIPESRVELLAQLEGTQISEGLHIIHYLQLSQDKAGDVCEFGVAQGATSALMAHEILGTDKGLWLFDSFKGLPKPTEKDLLIDDIFNLGTMESYEGTMAHKQTEVGDRLNTVGFPDNRVHIVDGFIEDTIKGDNLPQQVCFAYVDFDFYQPIKVALEFLKQVLTPGGYIIVDDYGFFSSGAQTAVDEFVRENNEFRCILPPKFAGSFCILAYAKEIKSTRCFDENLCKGGEALASVNQRTKCSC